MIRATRQARQLSFLEARAKRHGRQRQILCAKCRSKEARYGFRDPDQVERPSTLCFECFRMELTSRQEAERQRRSQRDGQMPLPLVTRAAKLARGA